MLRLASSIVAASTALAPQAASGRLLVGLDAAATLEQPDAIARGEALRQEAIEAFGRGDLEGAVEKFERAYQTDPSPAYLFNIGRVYEEMGELEKALEYYERFSREPHLELQERRKAGERIEVLRKLVGSGSSSGGSDSDSDGAVDSGDGQDAPEQTEPPPDEAGDPPSPRRDRAFILAGSSLLGVGAAIAIGGGLGFGLAARDRSTRIANITPGNNPEGLTLTQVEDLDAEGRTFELYQVVTATAGGGLAVAGAVLLGVGMARRAKRSTPAASVRPVLQRNAAGLVIRGRF